MSSEFTLVSSQNPNAAVLISRGAGAVVKSAADLISSEVKEKTGAVIPVRQADFIPACALAVCFGDDSTALKALKEITTPQIEHEEGFAVRSSQCVVLVSGKTPAGVLYGADHILDLIEYSDTNATLPVTDADDKPDNGIRGASFASHSYGQYVTDSSQLELMKQQVRFYARNRINTITVETTGKRWPGDLTSVVTWKYFPALADENRNADVAARIAAVNDLVEYAHSWAVKVIVYTTEFNHEPDIYERCPDLLGELPETWRDGRHNYIRGCICLSKDIAWRYWHAKVKEAIEALPNIDGLELWMAEVPSEFGICSCEKCREHTRSEWLEKWFNATRNAIDEVRPDLQLYIKTFQSSQGSLEVERFSPLRGKFPHHTTIVTKCQFGDMAYLNDPHPLLGWIQDGAEITEFDVGGEYRGCGLGAMVCCIPEYIAERIRLYYTRGLRGFYARHAVPTWPNKDLLDINDTAFYKLAWHVDADVDEIWQDWALGKFGSEIKDRMIQLLKLSDEQVNKSLYVRSTCANRHYYIFSDNLDSFRFMMVDLSAQMIEGGIERILPTPENITAIIKEKEEGIAAANLMLDIFEQIAGSLSDELRERLRSILARTERIAVVMRYLTEAIWKYFAWERSFSARERDGMRPKILRTLNLCEAEIDAAQKLGVEKIEGETFWGLWKVVDFDRARRMVEEIRGLVNFRVGQKADYTVTITPSTVGHPNTYSLHRKQLREIFGLPGEG